MLGWICSQSRRLLSLSSSDRRGWVNLLNMKSGGDNFRLCILDEIGDFFFQKEKQVLQESTKEKITFCYYFDFC